MLLPAGRARPVERGAGLERATDPQKDAGGTPMRCELPNISVNYEEYGEGQPLLVLHGWGLDSSTSAYVMELYFTARSGWRRIYPDLPGMGQTAGPDWLTSHDQVLEVLLAFIDALLPGRRFAVAGWSYGGLLARGLVLRRQAWIDGAYFLVPVMGRRASTPPRQTLVHDQEFVAAMQALDLQGKGDIAEIIDREPVQSPKLAAVYQVTARAVLAADGAFLERLAQATDGLDFSFDADDLPEPFIGPTLILTGRQDSEVGYQDAWRLLGHYPRATYAVLDRAGHLLFGNQPAVTAALVSEWLDRVEEAVGAAATPAD
jgi:pimeloyl-ACP methyl ester carboxylesterase